jgi:hypothetical protein
MKSDVASVSITGFWLGLLFLARMQVFSHQAYTQKRCSAAAFFPVRRSNYGATKKTQSQDERL